MRAFDLLTLMGEIDDHYIMDARKRPKKRSYLPAAIAAVLAVVILGTGGTILVNQLRQNSVYDTADSAPAEAAAVIPEAAPEEAPAEPASGSLTEISSVKLLAGAVYPASVAWDDYEEKRDVWVNNQVTEDTAYALNAFSYHTAPALLQNATESGCYSPLSLYQTLAILTSGAQNVTQEELLSLLGMTDLNTLREEAGKLYRVNYKDTEMDQLKIANSLWIAGGAQESAPTWNQDWLYTVSQDFYADIYETDFSAPETADALGLWIADNTGGKLHPQPTLTADTVMAVINTIFYQSQWADNFQTNNTVSDTFYEDTGTESTCDFMQRTQEGGQYVKGDGYTKSSLRLSTGNMIFVLPDQDVDIDTLLSEDKLWEIFETGEYAQAEVRWRVPKFTTQVTYNLDDTLTALGLGSVFDENTANFSTICDKPLYVSRMEQGVYIALNEDGVEASAYSMALAEAAEAPPEEEPTVIEMNLNRPFLYLITADDGSNLFLGVVRSPNT